MKYLYTKIILINDSEIILTIKGNNSQKIINNKSESLNMGYNCFIFNNKPSKILVNGNTIDYIDYNIYNLSLEINIITIKFNQTLTNCNVMFSGLIL